MALDETAVHEVDVFCELNAARQLWFPADPQLLLFFRSLVIVELTPRVARSSTSDVVNTELESASFVAVLGSIVMLKVFDVAVSVPSDTVTVMLLVVPVCAVPVITPDDEMDAQLGLLAMV